MSEKPDKAVIRKGPNDGFGDQIVKSLGWLAGLRYAGQMVSWISIILVMRVLNPKDFGLMAEANIAIGFLATLSELGLGVAIIQRREITHEDLRKVFGFVIVANCFLALLLWFGAPLLAAYFLEPALINLYRSLSAVFLLISFYTVSHSMLLRNIRFRSKSMIDFLAAIISSMVTLLLAYLGYGVWSLVIGAITMHVVWAVGYPLAARLFILPIFRFGELRSFISFGSLVTIQRILWYLYTKADVFIGGRFLDAKLLGSYSVALTLASLPLDKITPIINQVALPAYSKIQMDMDRVRSSFLKSVRMIWATTLPVSGILFLFGLELVNVFLGTKWQSVVLPMQILSVVIPLRILGTLLSPVLDGLGRPDISMQNVAVAFFVMIASFLIGVKSGITGLCFAWLFGYCIVLIIMCHRSLKIIGISVSHFFNALNVPLVATLVSLLVCYSIKYFFSGHLHQYLTLTLGTVLFLGMYIGLIFALDATRIYELFSVLTRWKRS